MTTDAQSGGSDRDDLERPPAQAPEQHHHASPLSPLSTLTRLLLLVIGWILILIGVAGLVLPGIQGILTIIAGAAVLSLASELAYRAMRRTLGPWPGMLARVERLRERVHGWLSRD